MVFMDKSLFSTFDLFVLLSIKPESHTRMKCLAKKRWNVDNTAVSCKLLCPLPLLASVHSLVTKIASNWAIDTKHLTGIITQIEKLMRIMPWTLLALDTI